VGGETQYRSHEWCPPGFYAVRFDDENARDLLWLYAQRIQPHAPERSAEIHQALREIGYDPLGHLKRTKTKSET
jgi:hypothetical protein